MNPTSSRGSVLVYLVVLLLLFGVLGVIITSLFTTSTLSSATPNHVRRAFYVGESAMRYAFSELRNSDFDTDVINTLNTTTYTVNPEGNFTFNIFGPWFEASADSTGGTPTLKVPEGSLTAEWMAKDPNGLWAVNYDYLDLDLTSSRDPISGWTQIDDTTLTITVGGNFNVSKGNRICLAVIPTESSTTLIEGDDDNNDLYIERHAIGFFPQFNGAVNINRYDYVYERLEDDPANDRALLVNLSASPMPNSSAPSSVTVENKNNGNYAGDFIVLSPRNHIVIPTVTADTVTVEGTLDNALNIYNLAVLKPMSRNPDIDINREILSTAFNQIETNTGFVNINDDDKTIEVGGGQAIKDNPEFGSVWFNADKDLGGKQGVCEAGDCEFGRGVRVFFTLDYDGTADGLTFALINAAHNTAASAGGDVAMGELLGYAGDSRKVTSPSLASNFLDGTGAGLQPPKMALEFDTYTNRDNLTFCNGTTKVNSNRNDPFNSNQDAVQFVFWGFTSLLAMPCRDYTLSGITVVDHGSYDDNQHDAGELVRPWTFTTSGPVRSTPTVAEDGTIYVGSDDGHLYAINPEDGSLKWKFPNSGSIGAVRSAPAIGGFGGNTVYFGSDDGKIYAVDRASGSGLWSYVIQANTSVRSPVIGEAGKVYVGAENSKFYGFTAILSKEWEFTAAGPLSYGRPAIGPNGIIYVSHRADVNSRVYALNPAQRELDPTGTGFTSGLNNEWAFDTGDGCHNMPGVDPTTGTIYSDHQNDRIVAITPGGAQDWLFYLGSGSDIDSHPVVGIDGTVYFGADNSKLYAINPEDRKNGATFPTAREWAFSTGGQIDNTPAIAPDGTILVLAKNGILYAVNPDGTEKWRYSITVDGTSLISSPTVGNEGVVYVGSSNNRLYAINNFAVPRNYKDKVVTAVNDGTDVRVAGEIVTVGSEINWLNGDTAATDPKGPWAVRVEVMRSLVPNANSKYEYTLHAWIRQCDSIACDNIFGTYYEDTRIEYAATPHLAQTIELDATQHSDFTRFLFGFTGATGSGTYQTALIEDFKLSFIRDNDPIAGD
jgi:outer membrane protein assembly factor BamB